ncbi:hypothetical protein [Rhodanobacter denitrificans]|uniref:Uncharacterized protein n=1 Tax=Rhodanobacter denitrificans TaxID=666685 RepID=M4NJL8_9GAMM|nr:hypothetical protein [Rhodanobacter denitrificans]AGG89883.1 hypothetical protein R2APBS1_2805 [Rhodanobacter denitrificans]UJM85279.1 hypothetical protein LRJ86_10865 [Rhodanobacter denitrificans]
MSDRIAHIRRLLADARVPDTPRIHRRQGPLGTARRKALMQHARLTAARYSLQAHLDAFVYNAGAEAITSLDLEQLEQLVGRLEHLGAALDAACDPPGSPPAR